MGPQYLTLCFFYLFYEGANQHCFLCLSIVLNIGVRRLIVHCSFNRQRRRLLVNYLVTATYGLNPISGAFSSRFPAFARDLIGHQLSDQNFFRFHRSRAATTIIQLRGSQGPRAASRFFIYRDLSFGRVCEVNGVSARSLRVVVTNGLIRYGYTCGRAAEEVQRSSRVRVSLRASIFSQDSVSHGVNRVGVSSLTILARAGVVLIC